LLPTLAALAGLKLPQPVDGVDLAPLLKGKPFEPRPFFVSYCQEPPRQLYMVTDARYKYIYSQVNGVEELYDLDNDPHETRNLAGRASAARVARAMRHYLVHWAEQNEDHAILDGRDLKVTHEDILKNAGFQDRTMGWRWY
jgi:arylsulfatase A-like enzyme